MFFNSYFHSNTSVDYTKTIFKFNATHIMMWTNEILTVKVFLRDIPLDLGDTKFFKFLNFDEGDHDLYKIYYWGLFEFMLFFAGITISDWNSKKTSPVACTCLFRNKTFDPTL